MKSHSAAYIAKKLLKLFGLKGQHWTTGSVAKSKSGMHVEVNDPKAVKFCMLGGLRKLQLPANPIADKIAEMTKYGTSIANFNDSSRFKTIRRFLAQVAAGA